MWWILAGVYVALTALTLWFLYRASNFPGSSSDDSTDLALPKSGKPRARHKLAAR